MKKLLFVITLLFSIISFGQDPIQVEIVPASSYSNPKVIKPVSYQNNYTQSLNQSMQAGAATRAARASEGAAQSAALANNSKTITTDFLINNDGIYKAIVVNKVSGWKPSGNKKSIKKILSAAEKYYYYSTISDVPQHSANSDKILYLDWIREAPTQYDRITTMTLKDYSGKIIYEATYKNTPYSEMLSPLTTNYVMNKDDAIDKIKQLKELLDMGVLTQDEFQKATQELKKVILKP